MADVVEEREEQRALDILGFNFEPEPEITQMVSQGQPAVVERQDAVTRASALSVGVDLIDAFELGNQPEPLEERMPNDRQESVANRNRLKRLDEVRPWTRDQ